MDSTTIEPQAYWDAFYSRLNGNTLYETDGGGGGGGNGAATNFKSSAQ